MHLTVWNVPETCSEEEVHDFIKRELGHYAKGVTVYDVGTPNAHADIELDSEVPYVGESVARELQSRRLAGVALRVSAAPFDCEGPQDARPAAMR
ncbi:hypothetical protein [Paraburkholderia oxyphila]|uniref:hypothetical protein n=1 Tax=Paraburkholderia oxyphila TaxID=614212 RepID=UPI000481E0E6|nr:hypothetical protein [Paraburkholderia oxyphila]